MRFAIVAKESVEGIPTVVVPIASGDLLDAVLARLREDVRDRNLFLQCEKALRDAFTAEENAVREATIRLGPEHE